MDRSRGIWAARLLAVVLVAAALATAELGRSAAGFFVPAAALLLQGVLCWFGRGRRTLAAFMAMALASEAANDLVLAFGEGLGGLRLDIAGVAFLVNLAAGGPATTLLSIPVLASLWFKTALRAWFDAGERGHA
jgi:hypothetical protein